MIHAHRLRAALASVLAVAAIFGIVAFTSATMRSTPWEKARVIPPPSIDEAASQATSEVAVLAGGCFWGVQAVYQHMKGVTGAVSGYAGGQKNTAHYETVGDGGTGHAEAVQVTFDPRQITSAGCCRCSSRWPTIPRSSIVRALIGDAVPIGDLPSNAEQEKVAKAYIAQLNQARVFDGAIMTKIEMNRPFYEAEG